MLQVSLHPYTLHFARPARTSRGALTTRPVWFVRAWDDADPAVAGWGEAGPVPGLSRDDQPDFAAACAYYVAAINAGAHPLLLDLGDLPAFAFGLETAIFDLYSGGRQQLWPTPFSRGEQGLPTHGLIWMDGAAGMLAQIEAKITAGFRVIKLKVGALPFADEVALLTEVRCRYPTIELRLDANGAFTPDEAVAKLEQLAPLEIVFLEQPIKPGQWSALAEICRQSPIPIALDEELIACHDLTTRRRLLDEVRPQHLILKPTLLGGLVACEAWAADAIERGIQWWANSLLESNVGLNALCQWTAKLGGTRVHGLGTGRLFTNNIPAPLALAKAELRSGPDGSWGFGVLGF
jgi:o-succinylbenzoate synthase